MRDLRFTESWIIDNTLSCTTLMNVQFSCQLHVYCHMCPTQSNLHDTSELDPVWDIRTVQGSASCAAHAVYVTVRTVHRIDGHLCKQRVKANPIRDSELKCLVK